MKLIMPLAFGTTVIIVGAVVAVPNLIGQTPNAPLVQDQPEKFPPPGFEPPFSHSWKLMTSSSVRK